MSNRLLTTTGLALAVVLLFAVNILSGTAFGWVRMDLTENGLYTLSQGTRNILSKLDEPITLRLYLSESQLSKAPQIAGYANRVKTLLREYERRSDGMITLHVIEPEPFSEEEDRAVAYGMRAAPVGGDEETLYFGLVGTDSTDDEEAIPFLTTEREEFLEYDVTKLVYALTDTEQTIVGLLSSLPIEGAGPQAGMMGGRGAQPWAVVDQMRDLFEVRSLNAHLEEVPGDVDVLMVVHPQDLAARAQHAIDQFVLRGGRAVVFVDPYSESQQGRPSGGFMMGPTSRRSDLDRLLEAWGVRLEPGVVADLGLAIKVQMQQGGRVQRFDYPVWMNVPPEQLSADDIVTGDIGNVAFGSAGSLVPVDGASTTFIPLVQTTDGAATFSPERVEAVRDPQDLLRDYESSGERYTLVARVSGPLSSAFPDGRPPREEDPRAGEGAADAAAGDSASAAEGEEEEALPPHVAESSEPANLVIVADSDLLADRFWVVVRDFLGTRIAVPSAANGTLVVNAIDNLSGSSDLISVRNRGSFVRPFEKVQALRREAELRYREKEEELMARLDETEQRLAQLQEAQRGEEGMILSDAQREELIRFRQEKLRIRKDLREVRRALREDIESLEAGLKFANIGLVPLLIALVGAVAGLVRVRRRRTSIARGGA